MSPTEFVCNTYGYFHNIDGNRMKKQLKLKSIDTVI